MITREKTGRQAGLFELEPKYVDTRRDPGGRSSLGREAVLGGQQDIQRRGALLHALEIRVRDYCATLTERIATEVAVTSVAGRQFRPHWQ